MSGHTPGPWVLGEKDRNDQPLVMGPDGQLVAICPHGCVTALEPEAEANARLIAAATEMAALLLSAWQHVSHGGPTRGEVESVLRKAGLIR